MYQIKCNACGYTAKLEEYDFDCDSYCHNCSSRDLEIIEEAHGDNFPNIYKKEAISMTEVCDFKSVMNHILGVDDFLRRCND